MIDKETGMSNKERMGEEIATLAARIDAATYELLVLIRKFDEQEGWNCGFLSCAHWLTWRIGLAPNAARERVRVARALAELPLMSGAMRRGELSYSKVRALTRIARPDTEESLVGLGRAGTAAHAERVVREWRRIDRTVEASDDELRDASSHLTTHIDENGMFVIRGRLAPEAGEVLMKALKAAGDKLYAEQPKDRPPAGKVRAGALALVAESALKTRLDPGSSGDRYQVVVHVNEEELKTPEGESTVDRRAGVSAETPRRNGAWLGDSNVPVSAETARRIACDAGKVCMSHRSGQILSVGRKTRTIPPPIRRALEFRDQGCASQDAPRSTATLTTLSTGPMAAKRSSPTSCSSAAGTTAYSTKAASECERVRLVPYGSSIHADDPWSRAPHRHRWASMPLENWWNPWKTPAS